MMSFLEKIRQQKSRLNQTETIVKTVSGNVLREVRVADGDVQIEKLDLRSHGFVVDMNPDLRVDKIVDGLYMGSQDVTQDLGLLRMFNLKHVLSVGVQLSNRLNVGSIDYYYLDALDVPEFDMSDVFEASYRIMTDVISVKRENLYIHCNAGVSRSASVVIAYLMKQDKVSYSTAYEHVKMCRSVIKPNEGFVKQLKLYETFLNKTKP